MKIPHDPILRLAVGALSLLALDACNRPSDPAMSQPVAIHVKASAMPPASLGAAAGITSFRLSIGQAAIGNGDQFGCVDCQDTGSEIPFVPSVIDVPLDARPVELATEHVGPGTYSMVEVEVVRPTVAPTGWAAGATMQVAGTFNGTPFTLTFSVEGSFRETVTPPVVVSSTGAPPSTAAVTITLPVGTWFTAVDGTPLNPNDPAQRAQIEANVQASFAAPEADHLAHGA